MSDTARAELMARLERLEQAIREHLDAQLTHLSISEHSLRRAVELLSLADNPNGSERSLKKGRSGSQPWGLDATNRLEASGTHPQVQPDLHPQTRPERREP